MTTFERQQLLNEWHKSFAEDGKLLRIIVESEEVVLIPEYLLKVSSFLSNLILESMHISKDIILVIPDIDKDTLETLKDILLNGYSKIWYKYTIINRLKEAAKILCMDLQNLFIVEEKNPIENIKQEMLLFSEIDQIKNIKKEAQEYFEIENVKVEPDTSRSATGQTASALDFHYQPLVQYDGSLSFLPDNDALLQDSDLPMDLTSRPNDQRTSSATPFSDFHVLEAVSDLDFDNANEIQDIRTPSPVSDLEPGKENHTKRRRKMRKRTKKDVSQNFPPRSLKPEIQYIYDRFFHEYCRMYHSRIDDCRKAPIHAGCGRRHSDFKDCHGNWLNLEEFENIAMKLDTFKAKVTPNKPPVSKLPELEYVYKSKLHQKCGKIHNRIELCDALSVHTCGRRHSFAKECDGSWMSLTRFESVALQWPSTLAFKKKLERSPDSLRRQLKSSIKKKQNINDKLKSTCITWNIEGKCDDNCLYVHRCSYMIIDDKHGDSICWGNHKEKDHPVSSRRFSRHSVGR